MPSFTSSLGMFLAASIFVGQIQVAIAVCSNFTFLTDGMEILPGYETTYKQKVDFVSCASSLNHSCQFLPKEYPVTAPTQLNVSTTQYFPDENHINETSIQISRNESYIYNTSHYSPDVESIFRLAGDFWSTNDKNSHTRWTIEAPRNFTVNTINITNDSRSLVFVNLNVRSGYNATLYYIPLMTFLWGRVSGCDNQSLDGFPMDIVMPHLGGNRTPGVDGVSGIFITEETFLNDSVVVDKKSLGSILNSWAGWSITSIALGVVSFTLL